MTRMAISPRFATNTLVNTGGKGTEVACGWSARANLPFVRCLLAALLSVLAALLLSAPALASSRQESFFQDDQLLTNSSYAAQAATLDSFQRMGVDTIHTVVNWRRLAPHPNARKPPKHFDGRDPKAYGATNWDIFDSLVRGARARGIGVLMSPAGPVPRWASKCRKNLYDGCRPSPKLYADFVTALARRYSGTYVDEDQDQAVLPRVARWSAWNEPNLGVWLNPQTRGPRGRREYIGAAYYRKLVFAMRGALDRTGHKRDQFLVGELAPLGGGATRTPPATFLRQLFCLRENGARMRGAGARRQGCRKVRRLRVSGISDHPYARGAGVPTGRRQRAGAITIGTIGRLVPILRAIRRHSPLVRRSLPVYITEFGVTTRPPDVKFGVAPNRQAQYLNLVDYLAYKRPWIKSVSQFVFADYARIGGRSTFQTGLVYRTGVVKPALQAYRIPIFVIKGKKRVTVWGQVRPVHHGTAQARVEVQNKLPGKPWTTLRTVTTNKRGYILSRFSARKGSWRIKWVEPDGTTSYSRGSSSVPASTPTTPGLPPPGAGTPPSPEPPSSDPNTPPPAPEEPPAAPPPPQYTLSVSLDFQANVLMQPGGGKVTSSPAGIDCGTMCSASYAENTSVTLTAAPDASSSFTGWSGDCSGAQLTCTVPMSMARSVKATFTRRFP